MKKSQKISLAAALILVAVTIVLIYISAMVCNTTESTIHPMAFVMGAVALLTPIACYPVIIHIEKLEEEEK